MATRQAYLIVSNELIGQLFGQAQIDWWRYTEANGIARDWGWLHKALRMPSNWTITGVSPHVRFLSNQTFIRVESPDFIETKEAEQLPEVTAVFGEGGSVRWQGPALKTRKVQLSDAGDAKGVFTAGVDEKATNKVRFREFL